MQPSTRRVACLIAATALLAPWWTSCRRQPSSPVPVPALSVDESLPDRHADRIEYVRAFLDAELGGSAVDPRQGWSEIDRERTATMITALSLHEVWGGGEAIVPRTSEDARSFLASLRRQLEARPEDEAVWRLKLFADALQEMSADGLSLVPETARKDA